MKLYAGIDLHSNNNYLAIVNAEGERRFSRKLINRPEVILETLSSFKSSLEGIVVESTFNWYWLVDLLMAEGYTMHLANPSAIQKYSGLKHADDRHDAFWLADMLRLNILPSSYIYPKQERPVRDLLRKRSHLVKIRTALITSLQNTITRNCGIRISSNDVKRLKEDRVHPLLQDNEDLALAGLVSKDVIDYLTRRIWAVEKALTDKVKVRKEYQQLLSLPGVGKVLALTIMLETGPTGRFDKVGNYVSYCRKVSSSWKSNGKVKGAGNRKNGNRYLAWAFSEAAELARRHDENSRKYYQRKMNKTNFMVAHSALAHKLARAAYFLMRDQVPFEPQKLFG